MGTIIETEIISATVYMPNEAITKATHQTKTFNVGTSMSWYEERTGTLYDNPITSIEIVAPNHLRLVCTMSDYDFCGMPFSTVSRKF